MPSHYHRRMAGQAIAARHAFTTVELLVSVAVIGVLMALVVPAVQSARESARRTQCRNHLRQLGVGVHNFESTHRYYPSNGWGFLWIGDTDRGVGRRQPGGWIYQLLAFMEAQPLAELGRELGPVEKPEALAELNTQPLPLLKCPTRPSPLVSPVNQDLIFRNALTSLVVAKTDYAINEGDYITDTREGPQTLEEGDDPGYAWTDVSEATGVSFQRSEIRQGQVTDGSSNTYLIGEKYVSRNAYHSAAASGYDQPMYSGVDLDINRWTLAPPLPDGLNRQERRFGSAHPDGCHFVFCDGSVRQMSYLIDFTLHQHLGNRKDGAPIAF